MPDSEAGLDPTNGHLDDLLRDAYPDLAAAITAVGDAVARDHVARVRRRVASAASLDDVAILDDLPKVIAALADTLGKEGRSQSLSLIGPAHASARFGQDFTLEEVIGEAVLLRESLHKGVLARLGRPLRQSEVDAFEAALAKLLIQTLASFMAQREARTRIMATAESHFLSSLAHDVRNELNAVLTTMALVDDLAGSIQEATQSDLLPQELRRTGQHLQDVLHDLTMSRHLMQSTIAAMTQLLEADRLRSEVPVKRRAVDLSALLQAVSRASSRAARCDEPEPRTTGPTANPIRVVCTEGAEIVTDPDLLSTAVINLTGNAVKHGAGSPIELRAMIGEAGSCRIEVRDEGPGMPPEVLRRVFDKYQRSTVRERDGFGLGLFIVRRAVSLLGGSLRAASEEGRGSRFTIELPGRGTKGGLSPRAKPQ